VLVVGKIEFPFPFPLVKAGTGWHFDGAAGREEIINRRVGRNELNAIALSRLYVEAQREYAKKDLGKDTAKIAEGITDYNPDKTWKLVQERGIKATD
jgi:hypothetical protein